jgi:hypothetical protein
MQVVGVILWLLAAVFTLSWMYGIRSYVRSGQGVSQQTVNQTMGFALSLVLIPVLHISPFHLLWMFIVAFATGTLSIVFPFSLLSVPGRFFGVICCFGLDQAVAARNRRRMERYRELFMEGLSPEQAKERLDRYDSD